MKSKYVSDWTCDCCGESQSKHNQYFDGGCEVCVVNTLTAEDEVISSPPLNKVFTIENYRTDLDYKSGRENRRQRRKEQRKKK